MKIRMQLRSDVVFGNGASIPGGEDRSVLCDENGFPYYKGGTFKGIFREELENYLGWTAEEPDKIREACGALLGKSGSDDVMNPDRLVFSDFRLSEYVRSRMLEEIGAGKRQQVLDALSHVRTFTAVSPDGVAQQGSLRQCRCINKGLSFYSELQCAPDDEALVEELLSGIKWVGTMRARGFGKVKLSVVR